MKRILGKITKETVEKYHLQEHENKKIVIYDNDRKHCEKEHLKEFKDRKTFHYIMDNLEYIIENPDYIFYVKGYDKVKNKDNHIEVIERYSLEYYKKLDIDITVRVRVDNSKELKVKTVFPVDENKIALKLKNEKKKQYVISEEEYKNKDASLVL